MTSQIYKEFAMLGLKTFLENYKLGKEVHFNIAWENFINQNNIDLENYIDMKSGFDAGYTHGLIAIMSMENPEMKILNNYRLQNMIF